jgi:hypothetical protein
MDKKEPEFTKKELEMMQYPADRYRMYVQKFISNLRKEANIQAKTHLEIMNPRYEMSIDGGDRFSKAYTFPIYDSFYQLFVEKMPKNLNFKSVTDAFFNKLKDSSETPFEHFDNMYYEFGIDKKTYKQVLEITKEYYGEPENILNNHIIFKSIDEFSIIPLIVYSLYYILSIFGFNNPSESFFIYPVENRPYETSYEEKEGEFGDPLNFIIQVNLGSSELPYDHICDQETYNALNEIKQKYAEGSVKAEYEKAEEGDGPDDNRQES